MPTATWAHSDITSNVSDDSFTTCTRRCQQQCVQHDKVLLPVRGDVNSININVNGHKIKPKQMSTAVWAMTKAYYLYETMSTAVWAVTKAYLKSTTKSQLLPVGGDVNQYPIAEVFLAQFQTGSHGRSQQMKTLLKILSILYEVFVPRLRKIQTSGNHSSQSECQSFYQPIDQSVKPFT